MRVEIITTGSELLLGRTLNTHQQWLGERFSSLGHAVSRQVTVGDAAGAIRDAVRDALERADLVVVTGGLGPTSDDLTRQEVAGLLDLELREDAAVIKRLEMAFRSLGRSMPESNRVQALVPVGARVLQNPVGTAPGLAIELDPNRFQAGRLALVVLLPGPPREMHATFEESMVPLLAERFRPDEPFVCCSLRTAGIPESVAQERIEPSLDPLVAKGLEVGYCARPAEVDIRLSAYGKGAADLVEEAGAIVRGVFGDAIYSESDEELEAVVVRLLLEQGQTLALAESCTGGLISHRVTNIPGASKVLLAGLVSYSNAAKQQVLGVTEDLIVQHGAVSERVARAMAEGARRVAAADIAVGVTGIAGPGGGTPDKPVGTVFVSLATEKRTVVLSRRHRWDRATFKQVTSQQALDLVRRHLLKLPLE